MWPKMWATFVSYKILLKINNRRKDENSPNLVTLEHGMRREREKEADIRDKSCGRCVSFQTLTPGFESYLSVTLKLKFTNTKNDEMNVTEK
jgi:hypothetical protein